MNKEKIDLDNIARGLHRAFRHVGDSRHASMIHSCIQHMNEKEWRDICEYVYEVVSAEVIKHGLQGMEVSMDVSTGDHDAQYRIFGTVAETTYHDGKPIILAIEDSRNFIDLEDKNKLYTYDDVVNIADNVRYECKVRWSQDDQDSYADVEIEPIIESYSKKLKE